MKAGAVIVLVGYVVVVAVTGWWGVAAAALHIAALVAFGRWR